MRTGCSVDMPETEQSATIEPYSPTINGLLQDFKIEEPDKLTKENEDLKTSHKQVLDPTPYTKNSADSAQKENDTWQQPLQENFPEANVQSNTKIIAHNSVYYPNWAEFNAIATSKMFEEQQAALAPPIVRTSEPIRQTSGTQIHYSAAVNGAPLKRQSDTFQQQMFSGPSTHQLLHPNGTSTTLTHSMEVFAYAETFPYQQQSGASLQSQMFPGQQTNLFLERSCYNTYGQTSENIHEIDCLPECADEFSIANVNSQPLASKREDLIEKHSKDIQKLEALIQSEGENEQLRRRIERIRNNIALIKYRAKKKEREGENRWKIVELQHKLKQMEDQKLAMRRQFEEIMQKILQMPANHVSLQAKIYIFTEGSKLTK